MGLPRNRGSSKFFPVAYLRPFYPKKRDLYFSYFLLYICAAGDIYYLLVLNCRVKLLDDNLGAVFVQGHIVLSNDLGLEGVTTLLFCCFVFLP